MSEMRSPKESQTMILDIGCGSNPIGDVNIDPRDPRTVDPKVHHWLNPKVIPNFILGVGENLPFRDNVFEIVEARGSIEHSAKMQKVILEMIRVSKNKIHFVVPHRFSKHLKYHRFYFTTTWIRQNLRRLQRKRIVKGFRLEMLYWFFPHPFFPLLRIPYHIDATVWLV